MDDLELLCPQRSQLLSDLQRRVVSCLLTLIDGVSDSDHFSAAAKRVFVLAASSQPGLVDTAMRRPGRLDRELELGVPSATSRGQILHSLLGAMGVHVQGGGGGGAAGGGITEEVVRAVARKAHGMVGADLLLVCKEAHMAALDRVTGLPYRAGQGEGAHHENSVDYARIAAASRDKMSGQGSAAGPESGDVEELASRVDLSLHLAESERSASPGLHSRAVSVSPADASRVTAADLFTALGRVTPSALREVTIEVPGELQCTCRRSCDDVSC